MTTDAQTTPAGSADVARPGTPAPRRRGKPGVPTFIETAPGSYTPIEECTKTQIGAEIMALLGQAEEIMESGGRGVESKSDTTVRSLIHQAELLGEYLNV